MIHSTPPPLPASLVLLLHNFNIELYYRISHFILYIPICVLCIFTVFDSYVNLCLYGTIKYFVLYCIVLLSDLQLYMAIIFVSTAMFKSIIVE